MISFYWREMICNFLYILCSLILLKQFYMNIILPKHTNFSKYNTWFAIIQHFQLKIAIFYRIKIRLALSKPKIKKMYRKFCIVISYSFLYEIPKTHFFPLVWDLHYTGVSYSSFWREVCEFFSLFYVSNSTAC